MPKEFLYPKCGISPHNDPELANIYMSYHKDNETVSLLIWNLQTDEYFNALPCYYSCYDFALIPEHKGVSFIDQGRIRAKYFHKRGVKAIDIDFPLKDPICHVWISPHKFLVCALHNEHYGIFITSPSGVVHHKIYSDSVHYILPTFSTYTNRISYVSYDDAQYVLHVLNDDLSQSHRFALTLTPIYSIPITQGYLVVTIHEVCDTHMTCIGSIIEEVEGTLVGTHTIQFSVKSDFIQSKDTNKVVPGYIPFMPIEDTMANRLIFTDYETASDVTHLKYYDFITQSNHVIHTSTYNEHSYAPIIHEQCLYYACKNSNENRILRQKLT